MNRRNAMAAIGAAAAGVVVGSAGEARAHDDDKHAAHYEACAKACVKCEVECEKNFHHCFKQVEGGKKEHAKVMHLSVDCAELCGAAGKLTARMSPLTAAACEACAKACELCAAECEKFPDSKEMQACAKECRECAKVCKEMVKMAGHKH